MKLVAAFLAGAGTGIALFMLYLGKTLSTSDARPKVPPWVHDTEYDGERWRA